MMRLVIRIRLSTGLGPPMLVLDDLLQGAVVDHNDGEGDFAPVVAPQAIASGRRLFRRAADAGFEPKADRGGVEVGSVVEQDVGTGPDDIVDVAQVLVVSNVAAAEYLHALSTQHRNHVVLRRTIVAGANDLAPPAVSVSRRTTVLRFNME